MRSHEKTREWERQRRDRLAFGFSQLLKEVPELASTENTSKMKILETAATYIRRLRELVANTEPGGGCRKCSREGSTFQDQAVQVDVRLHGFRKLEDPSSVVKGIKSADTNLESLKQSKNGRQLLTSQRTIRQLREILNKNVTSHESLDSNTGEPSLTSDANMLTIPKDQTQPVIVVNSATGSVVIFSQPQPKLYSGLGRMLLPRNKMPCSKLTPVKRPASKLSVKRKHVNQNTRKNAKKRKLRNSNSQAESNKAKLSVTTTETSAESTYPNTEPGGVPLPETQKNQSVADHNFSISNVLQPARGSSEQTQQTNANTLVPSEQEQSGVVTSTQNTVPVTQSVYSYPSCYYADSKTDSYYSANSYQGYYDMNYMNYNSFLCDPANSYGTYGTSNADDVALVTQSSDVRKEMELSVEKITTKESSTQLCSKVTQPLGQDSVTSEQISASFHASHSSVTDQVKEPSKVVQGKLPTPPVQTTDAPQSNTQSQITELVNATPESVSYQLLGQFQTSTNSLQAKAVVAVKPETVHDKKAQKVPVQISEQASKATGKNVNTFSQVSSLARTSRSEVMTKSDAPTTFSQNASFVPCEGHPQVSQQLKPAPSNSSPTVGQSCHVHHRAQPQSQYLTHAIGNLIEKAKEGNTPKPAEVKQSSNPVPQDSAKRPDPVYTQNQTSLPSTPASQSTSSAVSSKLSKQEVSPVSSNAATDHSSTDASRAHGFQSQALDNPGAYSVHSSSRNAPMQAKTANNQNWGSSSSVYNQYQSSPQTSQVTLLNKQQQLPLYVAEFQLSTPNSVASDLKQDPRANSISMNASDQQLASQLQATQNRSKSGTSVSHSVANFYNAQTPFNKNVHQGNEMNTASATNANVTRDESRNNSQQSRLSHSVASSLGQPAYPTYTNTSARTWTNESVQGSSAKPNAVQYEKCQKTQRILSVSQLVEQPKNKEPTTATDKPAAEKQQRQEAQQSSKYVFQPVTSSIQVAATTVSTFNPATNTIPVTATVPSTAVSQTLPVYTPSALQSGNNFSNHSKQQPTQKQANSYSEFDRNQSYKSYSRGYCAYSAEALINQGYNNSDQFKTQQPYSQWSYNQQYIPTATSTANHYNKTQMFDNTQYHQQFQFDQSFYGQSHHLQFSQDLVGVLSNTDSVGSSDPASFFQYSSEANRCSDKKKEGRQEPQLGYYQETTGLTVPLPSFSSILEDVSFADSKSSKPKPSQKQDKSAASTSSSAKWPSASYPCQEETKKNKKDVKQNHIVQSKKTVTSWNAPTNDSYQSSGSSNFNVSNIIPEIRNANPTATRHPHDIGNFQFNTDYGMSFPPDLSSRFVQHQNMHLGHTLPSSFNPMDFNFPSVASSVPGPFTAPHIAGTNFKAQHPTK